MPTETKEQTEPPPDQTEARLAQSESPEFRWIPLLMPGSDCDLSLLERVVLSAVAQREQSRRRIGRTMGMNWRTVNKAVRKLGAMGMAVSTDKVRVASKLRESFVTWFRPRKGAGPGLPWYKGAQYVRLWVRSPNCPLTLSQVAVYCLLRRDDLRQPDGSGSVSKRRVSLYLGLSLPTVRRAFLALEQHGLLAWKGGRKYVVKNPPEGWFLAKGKAVRERPKEKPPARFSDDVIPWELESNVERFKKQKDNQACGWERERDWAKALLDRLWEQMQAVGYPRDGTIELFRDIIRKLTGPNLNKLNGLLLTIEHTWFPRAEQDTGRNQRSGRFRGNHSLGLLRDIIAKKNPQLAAEGRG